MRKMAKPFIVFVERFYPDPFVFAILLTFVVFGMVFLLTPATPIEAVSEWGGGMGLLLEFIAQLSITLVTSHALAHTDPVRRGLTALGKAPKTPFQAYAMVALVGALASLIAWAFGLVVGALIARQVAMQGKERGLHLHYPLLVAAAYAGFVVWHMGYSSSAALFVATPGHAMEEQIGIIPVTDTIFASYNLIIAAVAVIAVPLVIAAMRPKLDARGEKAREGEDPVIEVSDGAITSYREELRRMDQELAGVGGYGPKSKGATTDRATVEGTSGETDTEQRPVAGRDIGASLAEMMDRTRLFSTLMGAALVIYLVYWFSTEGLNLTLDIVNWTFLATGLLLSRSALHYVKLVANASVTVGQIILQYPFYAGIMGLMMGTGLVQVISDWFVSFSTQTTLGFWAFISGGVVNFFIPSGGGQWAVQGPIFTEAARSLDVTPSIVVNAVAYGDQWSNMVQPFWTIPLLAIAGLHMRQIMGYTFVIFFLTFFIFGGGILIAGAMQ
jgi:short-chain fatty acids transporter